MELFRIPTVSEKISQKIINPVILDYSFKARFESNSSKIYNDREIWDYLFK